MRFLEASGKLVLCSPWTPLHLSIGRTLAVPCFLPGASGGLSPTLEDALSQGLLGR